MVLATRPIKLSDPCICNIESTKDKEPLPEIGFKKSKGTISLGMCKKFVIGISVRESNSRAPEARSILTAVTSPTSGGIMETVHLIPSLAPDRKISNTFIFFARAKMITVPMAMGRMNIVI